MIRSESMDDKVRGQKGNSPDHQLRSLIMSKWERRWIFTDNQEVGFLVLLHVTVLLLFVPTIVARV